MAAYRKKELKKPLKKLSLSLIREKINLKI